MENKEFQKRALEGFTRLEEGQVALKEEIKFVHDDLTTKIEMLADAIKELVQKMATKEEYEKRFREMETRIRGLEQKIGQ